MASNDFPPPPRITGDSSVDLNSLQEYLWALYRTVFLESGLIQTGNVGTSDLANGSVTLPKIQAIATDTLLGRQMAGSGTVELITCTAAGRALLDDASAATQRTTLGLGTLATASSVATGLIDGNAVTFAKMQDLNSGVLLGRFTAGVGDPEEITPSAGAKTYITDGIPILSSYAKASLPSAATYARGMIYVPDEVGGATPAFSDGTDWRRVSDRAVVS